MLAASAVAGEPGERPSPQPEFAASGLMFKLPPPAPELPEAGAKYRTMAEVFVPGVNRLVAAFIASGELAHMEDAGDPQPLTCYALVQVPRRGEFMECSPEDFADLVRQLTQAQEDGTMAATASSKEIEEELNRRLKSLDVQGPGLNLEQPFMLGRFFSRQDAYGFGMLMSGSAFGASMKYGAACTAIRVRRHVFFTYLYAEYKGEETIKWLRETADRWADALLKANPPE